ncbi:MAG: response regulator [Burkholderiales bacterium]|nr:response regulator [Burkholderiales bacterium]
MTQQLLPVSGTTAHRGANHTTDAVSQLVEELFIEAYLRNSDKAQIGLLLSALVAGLIWNDRSHSIWPIAWLVLFAVVTGLRYFKTTDFVLSATGSGRLRRIELTLLVNGVLMAVPLSAFATYSELERVAISIILMATATASTTTTSGYRAVFLAFALPMLAPLALAWALTTDHGASWLSTWGISALILFYLGFLVNVARQVAAVFLQSCQYRLGEQQTNQQLKAALDVADESNRAKTRFLAAASHDLRQPLHSINVLVATLSLRPLDSDTHDIIRLLDSVNQTMTKQLDALLDLSKLDAGIVAPNMSSHRLDAILQDHVQALAPVAATKGVSLVLDDNPALAVLTDDVLLRRVLGNLTNNALKFTPRGGTIRLKLWQEGTHAHLSIADTGIGIPAQDISRVFQEFYQVDNAERDRSKGLGLGLSIVQRLCQLMGIRVQLVSTPGEGTIITLSMQVTAGQPLAAHASPSPSAPVPQGLMVIVLDDEATVRQSMCLLLRQLGCLVYPAENTVQAVAIAQQHAIQVLFADHRLRGTDNGLHAIERIRAIRPQVNVVLVTGDTAPDRMLQAKHARVPMLHKPLVLEQVINVLNSLKH